MLGYWRDSADYLALARTQYTGQNNNNGGFGFYVHGNNTVYYGNGTAARVIPHLRMDGPFIGRHVGLLLDLDPASPYYLSVGLFWSLNGNIATMS